MSGDVQPRRRKDKKRRKDETGEQVPSQSYTSHSPSPSDDLNIHIHHDGGTGGGICAKVIFFLLFSALMVVIGLIIVEHRGLTELDTVDSESRFSQIFEGWVDNSLDHDHDEHLDKIIDDINDHEEQEDKDEVENLSEADEHDEEEEKELSEEKQYESDDNQELSEEENDDEDQEDDEQLEENEVADDEDEDVQATEEDNDSEEKQYDEQDDEDQDDEEQYTSNAESEEDNIEDEKTYDNDEEDIISEEQLEEQEDNDEEEEKVNSNEDEEVEISSQTQRREETTESDVKKNEEPEVGNQENSSMAVKLGVGVALLVVAYVVLIRKWKSVPQDSLTKEELKVSTPDMSRRNTIVAPPSLQEVEQDLEQDEEDYSDEEGELDSEDERAHPKSAKAKYQELRSTYTRSLTPESEPEYQTKPTGTYEEESEDEENEEGEEIEEEEEIDSENEEYDEDEDEDEELLKRLEEKYGKLKVEGKKQTADEDDEQLSSWKRVNVRPDNEAEESDSDKQSDDGGYEYTDVTNKEDSKIKDKIDEAQKATKNHPAYAIKLFDKILEKYPFSPRSLYGKAMSLDYLADQKRSNEILNQALNVYLQLLTQKDVTDTLFAIAAEKCISRMRFIGQYSRAVGVHKLLMKRFPDNPKYPNDLAVTYLTINRMQEAKSVLTNTLSKWPNDGFALVHFGFILKTVNNNLNDSIQYMRKGIATKSPGVIDGRFYFHLGDALARMGKVTDAMKVYEEGVENKVFLSKYQRSLYNVPRLTGKPWWGKENLPYKRLFKAFEDNWMEIRREGLSVLNEKGHFRDETENLRDTGDWKQFELFARGQKNVANCKKCPITCKIIENAPEASGCKRGQTKFSVLRPGTHVWPHCGPTNCRLRVHLGLKVPRKTFIRVAEEIRSWEEGKLLIFDDSFEHEVWHNGTDFRLVLIVDVWHPELTPTEKIGLSPI